MQPDSFRLRAIHFARDPPAFLGPVCGRGGDHRALNCLLQQDGWAGPVTIGPGAAAGAAPPHFPARAKHVIFLFMAGGPSQLELFDDKPKLRELHGQKPPPSLLDGKRFAFLKGNETLLGSAQVRPLRPVRHDAQRTAAAPAADRGRRVLAPRPDHRRVQSRPGQAVYEHRLPGPRPARHGRVGDVWLGSPSRDLPGFVVLQSGPRGPRAGAALWSSGFLPTSFQGVPFRGKGDPILNLRSPSGLSRERERDFYDTVTALNRTPAWRQVGDPEITTRINAYEMAFRMQTSARS